jgi:EF hand
MKKILCAVLGSSLLGLSGAAVAADEMMKHDAMVMTMDANGDGKISKDEFMAYHEKMWMGMKKDSNGRVDAKSMMHHEGMMKDNGAMQDKAMSGDKMQH